MLYLQHDHTDLFDTLDDGQRGPSDSDGSLSGVGQHVSSHLYLSSCRLHTQTHTGQHQQGSSSMSDAPCDAVSAHLPDLFDLAAALADERAALAGRHHDPQRDRRLGGGRAVGHGAADVLIHTNMTSSVLTEAHVHHSTAFHLNTCIQTMRIISTGPVEPMVETFNCHANILTGPTTK